jgi:hypothetical protein
MVAQRRPGVYVSFGNPVSDGKSPAVGEKDSNELLWK